MALNKRDRIGLFVLLGLFCAFAVLLYFTVDRPSGPLRGFDNNVVVQQRIKNQQNQSP
jgi:hypothetical protein